MNEYGLESPRAKQMIEAARAMGPALVQRSAEVFVYTIEDGRASMREVTHGTRNQGWVEILSGLSEGEAVITEGVIKVRNGAPVSTGAQLSSSRDGQNSSGDD